MSETEKLLQEARQIARRAFESPSEDTIMEIFRERCAERSMGAPEADERDSATLH